MKIVIRTDSSATIGSGHAMRCLTLAESLRHTGASIAFISRDLPGHLGRLVDQAGFKQHLLSPGSPDGKIDYNDDQQKSLEVIRAEAPVDWLVVDHYSLDITWESAFRPHVRNIMVIDDLADRKHDCDLLLDQNLYPRAETRYNDYVPAACQQLLGPSYALLREEFTRAHQNRRRRDGALRRLLISMGGADPHQLTEKALMAIAGLKIPSLAVDVVVGLANPHFDSVLEISSGIPQCNLHHPAKNMALLMNEADLCLGAAGSTTWERCCLGLPTLFIASGDNEVEIAESAETTGIGHFLGRYDAVDSDLIAGELERLFHRPDLIRQWGQNAAVLVDGQGTERVGRAMAVAMMAGVKS